MFLDLSFKLKLALIVQYVRFNNSLISLWKASHNGLQIINSYCKTLWKTTNALLQEINYINMEW